MPTDATMLEERRARRCRREAFAYVAGGAGSGRDDARQPGGVRPLADRAAHAARRVGARHERRAVRAHAAVAVPARADRRARDGAPRCRARGGAGGARPRACRWSSRTRRRCRWRRSPRSWATRRAGSSSTGARATSSSRASSRRAEACGCEAIVVTLDTTILGWRTRDLDLGVPAVPARQGDRPVHERPGVHAAAVGAARRPASPSRSRNLAALQDADPVGAELSGPVRAGAPVGRARAAVQRFIQIYSRPSLTWDDLPFLRERTRAADPAEGHPAIPTTRAARSTRAWTAIVRLEPRRPPGGRSDRDAGRAAGVVEAVDGRDPGAARQRHPERRRHLQGAGARRAGGAARAARTCTAWRIAGEAGVREVVDELPGRLRPDDGPGRLPLGVGDHGETLVPAG